MGKSCLEGFTTAGVFLLKRGLFLLKLSPLDSCLYYECVRDITDIKQNTWSY